MINIGDKVLIIEDIGYNYAKAGIVVAIYKARTNGHSKRTIGTEYVVKFHDAENIFPAFALKKISI